jgi:hypothetical protein
METKSYSKEIAFLLAGQASPISPADQEAFVIRLLADVKTHLSKQDDGTFEITFNEPFVSDFPQHVKDRLRRRTVAMRPDVKPDSEHVEYLALGHPVVDDLIARVTSPDYVGSAAAFEIEATDGLMPDAGWLVVYELGVPALHDVRELSAFVVHDLGELDVDLGHRLLVRCAGFPNDHALTPTDVPTDSFDQALSAAESAGFTRLQELEEQAHIESERQLERERAKLAGYFNYRDQAAQDRLVSSQRVLAGLEISDSVETRRILPVWRANVARDERLIDELAIERVERLAQLEQRAVGGGDLRLVGVARIEIVGDAVQ